jgi:hypothetical protein
LQYTALSYSELRDWLQSVVEAAGFTGTEAFPPYNEGPYIPDEPDKLITLTLTAGTGFSNQGATDGPTFQVRVRSDQNAQQIGEEIANRIDSLLLIQLFPQTMPSGRKIRLVSRVGGAPASMGPPDDAYRFDYVCNYYAIVGTKNG